MHRSMVLSQFDVVSGHMTSSKVITQNLYSIGHSTMPIEAFVERLRDLSINAVADVRSSPYSGRVPHFNRPTLRATLQREAISYVFLGKELGGRPIDPADYSNGVADYEKMSRQPAFADGIERLKRGTRRYRIAMMCSEHDPLECHRCLLVSRKLKESGLDVQHVRRDGSISTQAEIEDRLLEMHSSAHDDFFAPRDLRLADAYRQQAGRFAYSVLDNWDKEGVA